MSKEIVVEQPDQQSLTDKNVFDWPIWSKEVSQFPWTYDENETCYILEGEVTVTPEGGQPVVIKKGDLVTFKKGLSCTWQVHSAIRKHYKFF